LIQEEKLYCWTFTNIEIISLKELFSAFETGEY